MFLDVDRPVATISAAGVRRIGRIVGALAAVGCLGLGGLLAAQEVRVAQGDTLSAIARRTGSSVQAIAQANGLADPNRIVVGQVLVVPGAAPAPAPAPQAQPVATSGTHVVQPGDTLSSIARRFGTTVGAIQLANGIVDANRIRVGTALTVAGAPAPVAAPATPAPAPAATPTPAPAAPAAGAPAGRTVSVSYVVRSGDSLSSIAQRFGIRVSALRTANRLTGDQLTPGQRLSIPLAG
jgi:LysM repeat protein